MRGASSSHGKRKTHSGVDSRGFQMESPSALHNHRPPSSIDCSELLILPAAWRLMLPAPQVLAFQVNKNSKGPSHVVCILRSIATTTICIQLKRYRWCTTLGYQGVVANDRVFGSAVLRLSAQLDHPLSALFMLLSFYAQLDHPL
ncbi:hypothetical protein Tco_0543224 [Tanacetum coccineum]